MRTPAPHRGLLRALREGYAAWGGREARPTIAIVDRAAVDTSAEFKVLSGLFSAEGHRTLILDPGQLEIDGDRLSAGGVELVLGEQESFVLKPNDEYGGKGVLLGWQTPPDAWRKAVRGAADQRTIVQERSRARTARMPTLRGGGLVEEEVYFDLCPFVFAGRMEGAMVRLSASAVSNVSAGGGVTGLLIVDDARTPREDMRHVCCPASSARPRSARPRSWTPTSR
ncbi:hypothetical protein WMF28_10495 [Sorangium sp. So ce590]|uniref:hypothetical protein n=1 Tax=Sorangium sp. So ce590 TaxID=3133317 RepID=UPI003F61A1A9